MKARCVLAVLTFILLAAVFASGGEFTVQPYGFVLLNAGYNSNTVSFPDLPLRVTAADGEGTFNMTARQSRFGLSVKADDEVYGADIKAKIELDFFGLKADSKVGATQTAPRLRLAYGQLVWDSATITFGQDWGRTFAPLNPESMAHMSIPALASSGNLWQRSPQVRFDYTRALSGEMKFDAGAALLRPVAGDIVEISQVDTPGIGEYSKMPFVEGRFGVHRDGAPYKYAAGVGLHYGKGKILDAENLDDNEPVSFGVAVDGLFQTGKFEFEGEYYDGKNLPMFLSNSGYRVVTAQADPSPDTVSALVEQDVKGGWVQGSYKPMEKLDLHVAYGIDDVDDASVAAGSSTPLKNSTLFGNAIFSMSKHLKFSAEVGYIKTEYKVLDGLAAEGFRVDEYDGVTTNFALQLLFP